MNKFSRNQKVTICVLHVCYFDANVECASFVSCVTSIKGIGIAHRINTFRVLSVGDLTLLGKLSMDSSEDSVLSIGK